GEAEHSDGAAFENEELFLEFLNNQQALRVVSFERALKQAGPVAVFHGNMMQRQYIFAEATTSPTDACAEKMRTNSGVQADALGHLSDIGAHTFADIRDFVGEANLHSKEGIGCVLDHFRAGESGNHHRDTAHTVRTG